MTKQRWMSAAAVSLAVHAWSLLRGRAAAQRGALVLAMVCGGLALAPGLAQAHTNDYSIRSQLSPNPPPVGTNYALYVTVTNTSGRTILFEAFVNSVPARDRLLSPNLQERFVGPGETYTFRFDIYCGEPDGTVNRGHRARFVN